MALIGNYSVLNKTPGRALAGGSIAGNGQAQTRAAWNRSTDWLKFGLQDRSGGTGSVVQTAAKPNGYYPPGAWALPVVAGNVSMGLTGSGTLTAYLYPAMQMQLAITGVGTMSLSISGRKPMALTVTGSGALAAAIQARGNLILAATGAGNLQAAIAGGVAMAAALSGSGNLTAAASLVTAMALALSGSGTLSAGISGRLAMAATIFGSGDLDASAQGRWNMALAATGSGDFDASIAALGNMIVELTGEGDLDAAIGAIGNMSIDLVVTGTGLTSSNVGAAVWSALASANNVPGSMGEKLNDAGSASNPWTEVIESGYTAADIMRLLAAVMAGKSTGGGTDTVEFTGLDGATVRISATVDENGNRSDVTKDPT